MATVYATLTGTSTNLTVGLSGATGTVTYQWQSSTTGASNSFSDITSATSATFNYSSYITTTYIRPVVTDGTNTYDDIAVIKVYKDSNNNTRIDITFGSDIESIGSTAFFGCTSLATVVIGDSVTSIGYYAFFGCTSLATVVIGDSVTSIGYYAFFGCTSLATVVIGDSVTSIGYYAFFGCTSLANVYFLGTKPSFIDTNNFTSNFDDTAYYRAIYKNWGTVPDNIDNLQYIPTIDTITATQITGSRNSTLTTVLVYVSSDDGLTWTTSTITNSNESWSLNYSFETGKTYKVSTIANYYDESKNTTDNSIEYIYCKTLDLQSPTLQITSDKSLIKSGETATLTFTFSETVTGFDSSDVTTSNGTLGTLSGSGTTYTTIFTPTVNYEGTATISIAANKFSDAAGNPNTAASLSITVDTLAPNTPAVTGTSSNTISGTAEAGSTLVATNTNNVPESVSVDNTGKWRLNVASIDSYVFRARDTAGNISNPTTFSSSSFSFRYSGSSTPFRFPVGAPINSIGMSSAGRISGDTSTSFKIKPALPPGLSFSRRTGKITGTPLETSPATKYTITSQSTVYASRSAKITIEVL